MRCIRDCLPRPIPCPRPASRMWRTPVWSWCSTRSPIRTMSAAAFGVAAVVTTARHSPEATGVLAKSASGALELVPIAIVQNLARALAGLKERGFLVVGLDSNAPDDLGGIKLHAPIALVLGAEGKGL